MSFVSVMLIILSNRLTSVLGVVSITIFVNGSHIYLYLNRYCITLTHVHVSTASICLNYSVTSKLVNALTETECSSCPRPPGPAGTWALSSWLQHLGPVSANQEPVFLSNDQWEASTPLLPAMTHCWCMAQVTQDHPSLNTFSVDQIFCSCNLEMREEGGVLMFERLLSHWCAGQTSGGPQMSHQG